MTRFERVRLLRHKEIPRTVVQGILVSESNGSETHAARGRDGRQEGREGGYYYLHRYLNNPLLHASPPFRLILVEAIVTIVVTVVTASGIVTAAGIVTTSGIGSATLFSALAAALLTALAAVLTLRASILCVLCSLCVFVVLHLAAVAGGYELHHFPVLVVTGQLDRGVIHIVLQDNVEREEET